MLSKSFLLAAGFLLARKPSSGAFLPTPSQRSFPPSTAICHVEPTRNGMTEPGSQRDALVQDLQSEIAALHATIAEQKDNYQTTMATLQADADVRVEEATKQVNFVKTEYDNYKAEIQQKLKNASTPAEMAKLKAEVADLDERAATLKNKLDEALAKLRQNKEDRQNLQGEMVALRQGYIERLNEMEDQLEFVQDERVRDQQEGAKRMAEIAEENKKKLKEAIEDGRKQVEELTLVYTQRLAQKDDELAKTQSALKTAFQTVREKDEVIEKLETDAQSIRKLLGKSLSLVKTRVSKRLRTLVPGKNRGR
eukprot:scaffold1168_cov167-Amphora_coffeaeformis.AAC.10